MAKIPKPKILFLFLFFYFLFFQPVFAADIFFGTKINEARIGEQFEVKILINASKENINAFEGKIIFPDNLLEAKEIRDGDSVVNFWINKPKIENGAIAFSGITPGGFQGDNGALFSVVFEAKSEGVARFEIQNAKVLKNDGAGSQAILTISPFELNIHSNASAAVPAFEKTEDNEPPESFLPMISKSDLIADGKWFAVFSAQDKNSGINYYEIKESRQKILSFFSKWEIAESPYVLKDQELKSYIYVKAVDKSGNSKIIIIPPKYPFVWWRDYLVWSIIITATFLIISFLKLYVFNIKKKTQV